VSGGPDEPAASQPLSVERLVNLTPHDIVLQAEPPSEGQGDGPAEAVAIRLAPDQLTARVDDKAASLGSSSLNTAGGSVRITRMRRSARLVGLPAPVAGTRLVVSRVTALAARRRRDLLFPLDELRDSAGRIIGVRGLGEFRAGWAPRQRYRDWRAAARVDLAARPLGQDWLTGVLFVTATALLSGFLALAPGAIDGAAWHSLAGGHLVWTFWSVIFFLTAGGSLLGVGAWRWRRRVQILAARGTAYVIDEVATQWQHEEKESVLADIKAGFARRLIVPGPSALDQAWQWRPDAEAAERWDASVDTLVRSFWAVHYNDDQITKNALFTWAPWPVAVAFAARATARHRGLVLHVRQRPSYGAIGPRADLKLPDPAYDFLRSSPSTPLAKAAPDRTVTKLGGKVRLTVESLNVPTSPEQAAAGHQHKSAERVRPPLLLLVRTTHGLIGPIPMDLAKAPPVTVHAAGCLVGSLLPEGTHTVTVAEWRLDSETEPVPELAWEAFPAAADEIANWIVAAAAAHPDRVVLLGTRIPQELTIGLGIQLGQRRHEWPMHAYPVYYAGRRLTVPDLRLGADSVPAERT
jgi:hypothetical protein